MISEPTIAAPGTAPGMGGIGVIRISGPEALECALKVFHPSHKPNEPIRERYLHYGIVKDAEGIYVDNGFMAYMKSPRSYTGEDVVELYCHGGMLVLRKVLELVLKHGARLARPGEFTKRAFLNDKMDLAQAESVIEVIRSGTDAALASASARLRGALSKKIVEIKQTLVGILARMEASLDFPEEETGTSEGALETGLLVEGLDCAGGQIKKLLDTYEEGHALKDGVRTLILGRTNAGKSSLLNILLKQERAIVTSVPGTTRDIIEEVVDLRGLPVRLMDTAGLRDDADDVEAIGVQRARERITDAGLVLFVVDSTSESFDEDLTLLDECKEKKTIVVVNKVDLAKTKTKEKVARSFTAHRVVLISALEGTGIEELKDAVYDLAVGHGVDETPAGELVASLRHKVSLELALKGIERTRLAVEQGLGREFPASDLRWSLTRLGEITGETTTEEILERIFEDFCIGK